MPIVRLDDRAVISVSGPEAEHFLQNILTVDLDQLVAGTAKPGALLSPQGKILFDFLVSRSGTDGFDLECRSDVADDFVRRLMLYRLRAKVEIAKRNQGDVTISWDAESGASRADSETSQSDSRTSRNESAASDAVSGGLLDLRFPEGTNVRRRHGADTAENADAEAWALLRIAHGVAESGADFALGDAFPHDVLLDQNGGVGFRKGCYVGQEVVSRMQHRGTARRRVLIAEAESLLPAPGTPMMADGKPIGALGTVAGRRGLALARIDKVKDAMDAGAAITAGDAALTLSIPPGAKFGFPEAATSANEA